MIGYIGQNRNDSRLYPNEAVGQEDGQSEVVIRKCEPCIFCGEQDTEYHLGLCMCKHCKRQVAEGFEKGNQ